MDAKDGVVLKEETGNAKRRFMNMTKEDKKVLLMLK